MSYYSTGCSSTSKKNFYILNQGWNHRIPPQHIEICSHWRSDCQYTLFYADQQKDGQAELTWVAQLSSKLVPYICSIPAVSCLSTSTISRCNPCQYQWVRLLATSSPNSITPTLPPTQIMLPTFMICVVDFCDLCPRRELCRRLSPCTVME